MKQLDISSFSERYQAATHPLDTSALAGFQYLFNALQQDQDVVDNRWAAYMLATVRHECAGKWQPIEEFGRGAGKPYGQTYYGRGYVQLTWQRNYLYVGSQLDFADEFVTHPEKILEPEIAYMILSSGMRHGWFTGVGLGRFINDNQCDYLNARKIINGLDRADKIAGYAKLFEELINE